MTEIIIFIIQNYSMSVFVVFLLVNRLAELTGFFYIPTYGRSLEWLLNLDPVESAIVSI